MANNRRNTKLALLAKLFNEGYCTEKEIAAIDLKKALKIKSFNKADLEMLSELQDAIKANKLISFLSGACEKLKE